jgi:cytochrome b involved in lipid metabolism
MDLADEKGKLEVMILNIKAILNTDALEKIAKKDGEIKFYINKIKEPKKKVTHFGYTLKPVDGNSQPQKTSSNSEVIKGKNEDKLPF